MAKKRSVNQNPNPNQGKELQSADDTKNFFTDTAKFNLASFMTAALKDKNKGQSKSKKQDSGPGKKDNSFASSQYNMAAEILGSLKSGEKQPSWASSEKKKEKNVFDFKDWAASNGGYDPEDAKATRFHNDMLKASQAKTKMGMFQNSASALDNSFGGTMMKGIAAIAKKIALKRG